MEWTGNYEVNYNPKNRTASISENSLDNPFTAYSKGTNILLYLNQDRIESINPDKSLAYGLSSYRDHNVIVATKPNLKYAEGAHIVIPRIGDSLYLGLKKAYGDSKLIIEDDK